ncbi:hypothetical protein [Geopseudomonas aromaticivorans]
MHEYEAMSSERRRQLIANYQETISEYELDRRYADRYGNVFARAAGMRGELELLVYYERRAQEPQDAALAAATEIRKNMLSCDLDIAAVIRRHLEAFAASQQPAPAAVVQVEAPAAEIKPEASVALAPVEVERKVEPVPIADVVFEF